ncbi:MAG: energy-coupling factor transporter transmembrane component T family protein [Candidatus Heimdallarchaeota archaeon]
MAFSDIILLAQDKRSFFHGLDPRTKLCLMVMAIILSLLFVRFSLLLGVFLGLIFLAMGARILQEWTSIMRSVFYFVIFIFFANTVIYGYSLSPKPLNIWDPLSWGEIFLYGIEYGTLLAFKLLIFTGIVIFFILTTDLEDLGIALRKIGFPYELIFGIVASARFIPVLIDDAETIIKANMVKGVEFQHCRFFTKIKRYAGLLIPLVIVALKRSYRLAEAMEARGFGAAPKRSYYSEVKMEAIDWFVLILVLVTLLISILYWFFDLSILF